MEWTKIHTSLIVNRIPDKDILAITKYQLLWAELEEQPDDATALRYMSAKQLATARQYIGDITADVCADIASACKNRNKRRKKYRKNGDNSQNVLGTLPDTVPNTLPDTIPTQTRQDKRREDNITPLPPLKGKESLGFVSEQFKPIFQKWLDYKKEKKQSYKSKMSLQQCYHKLLELANNDVSLAEKVVNQSIANNWAGLFALKDISKTTPNIVSPLQKAIDNILEFMLANYEEKGISTNPTLRERYVKKWTPTITDLINACGGDLELAKKMIALYSKKQNGEEWYLWGVLNNFCSLYEELKRGQYVKR